MQRGIRLIFTIYFLPPATNAFASNVVVAGGMWNWENYVGTVCWIVGCAYVFSSLRHFWHIFRAGSKGKYRKSIAVLFLISGAGLLSFPFIQTAMCGPCHSDFYYFYIEPILRIAGRLMPLLIPLFGLLPWIVVLINKHNNSHNQNP